MEKKVEKPPSNAHLEKIKRAVNISVRLFIFVKIFDDASLVVSGG